MDKLAELDTSFLVPCVRCEALLQEGERFCPACGEDQLYSTAAFTAPVRPGAATGLLDLAAAQGVGWLRPRADDAPDAGIGPMPSPGEGRSAGRRPSAIAVLGIVAALAMAAFASMWGIEHYDVLRDQAGPRQSAETAIAQLRAALDRDDLAGAERALSMLDATQTGTPGVLALKQGLDQRVLAQAQRREQLSSAAQSASRSLGFGEAAASSVAVVPSPSPPVPSTPAAPPPAVVPRKDCNDALAALALCQPR